MWMSASGSSASRKSSCATMRFADCSETSVPRKTIRSRRRREKMSNERSKRPSDSTTIGTSWLNALPIGCAIYTQPVGCMSSERRSRADRARNRLPGVGRRGVGGADRAGAARGVVRDRGRARRAAGRHRGLPLGRRRRAAGSRARGRARGAARARLGGRGPGGARARRGRRRHARPGRRALAGVEHGTRAARARVGRGRVEPVLDAPGDPGPRSLVEAVASRGSATATELAAGLPVTRQAVAKQLAALADAGLLRSTRAGRETRYEVTPEPLGDAVAWMVDVGAAWDERLAKLRRALARGRAAR